MSTTNGMRRCEQCNTARAKIHFPTAQPVCNYCLQGEFVNMASRLQSAHQRPDLLRRDYYPEK